MRHVTRREFLALSGLATGAFLMGGANSVLGENAMEDPRAANMGIDVYPGQGVRSG